MGVRTALRAKQMGVRIAARAKQSQRQRRSLAADVPATGQSLETIRWVFGVEVGFRQPDIEC